MTQETPNREIGFGFVSCSCRACERAGEAKLCGRVRGECLSTLRVSILTFPPAVVVFLVSAFRFCCYLHGFEVFFARIVAMLMGFLFFLVCDGMLMVFLMRLHTLFVFAAMLMVFLIFSCF